MSKTSVKQCRYVVSIILKNEMTYFALDYTGNFWSEDLTKAASWRGKVGLNKARDIRDGWLNHKGIVIYIDNCNHEYDVNAMEISSISARELVLSVI